MSPPDLVAYRFVRIPLRRGQNKLKGHTPGLRGGLWQEPASLHPPLFWRGRSALPGTFQKQRRTFMETSA